ncbi:MAG: hypothetical protein A2039_00425 [Candidatus Melainabacteria bacterium GWA2_34_9]|nr:MAG: hypothetical protein A2039_00425 [Candidatus Melainabacteria bacterium GWA2_34_9]
MAFKNCSICDSLFDNNQSNLCPACEEIEAMNIKKITDYFQSFENLQTKSFSLNDISSETGIELQEMERLYKTNKLRSYTSLININCKLCGSKFKPTIFSGVFCKKCTNKVENVASELKGTDNFTDKSLIENSRPITDKNKGFRYRND